MDRPLLRLGGMQIIILQGEMKHRFLPFQGTEQVLDIFLFKRPSKSPSKFLQYLVFVMSGCELGGQLLEQSLESINGTVWSVEIGTTKARWDQSLVGQDAL